MPTNEDRIWRWLERNFGQAKRDLAPNGTVFYYAHSPQTLYSFGPHFPLAQIMHDRRGRRWALLNGDRYILPSNGRPSRKTAEHQGMVRRACQVGIDLGGLHTSMIVPFSALGAAGIRSNTIEPVEVREDRFEQWLERCEPTGPYLYKQSILGRPSNLAVQTLVPGVRFTSPFSRRAARWLRAGERFDKYAEDLIAPEDGWYLRNGRHRLGDSLFQAQVVGERTRKRFLSSFDYNERVPLYFLCELPRSSSAKTVAEAFEDLKPRVVRDAEAIGLGIERQGDVFAVPTELTTRQLKMLTPYGKGRIVKHPKRGLIGTNHTASEVLYATEGRVYARGCLYHEPGGFREPDHARRRMGDGKTWHLLIKNTVPQQRQRTRERGAA